MSSMGRCLVRLVVHWSIRHRDVTRDGDPLSSGVHRGLVLVARECFTFLFVFGALTCTQPGSVADVPDAMRHFRRADFGILGLWAFTSEAPVMFLVGFDPVTSSFCQDVNVSSPATFGPGQYLPAARATMYGRCLRSAAVSARAVRGMGRRRVGRSTAETHTGCRSPNSREGWQTRIENSN